MGQTLSQEAICAFVLDSGVTMLWEGGRGGAEETRQHTSPYSLKGKCLSAFIYYSAAEAGILIDHSHSGDNPIVFDSLH